VTKGSFEKKVSVLSMNVTFLLVYVIADSM